MKAASQVTAFVVDEEGVEGGLGVSVPVALALVVVAVMDEVAQAAEEGGEDQSGEDPRIASVSSSERPRPPSKNLAKSMSVRWASPTVSSWQQNGKLRGRPRKLLAMYPLLGLRSCCQEMVMMMTASSCGTPWPAGCSSRLPRRVYDRHLARGRLAGQVAAQIHPGIE
jgi:hypothetical protein